MSLKRETPCDYGPCPYDAELHSQCEYYCGAEEPEDYPEAWECGVDECPEADNTWETVVDELSKQNPNWEKDLPF